MSKASIKDVTLKNHLLFPISTPACLLWSLLFNTQQLVLASLREGFTLELDLVDMTLRRMRSAVAKKSAKSALSPSKFDLPHPFRQCLTHYSKCPFLYRNHPYCMLNSMQCSNRFLFASLFIGQ